MPGLTPYCVAELYAYLVPTYNVCQRYWSVYVRLLCNCEQLRIICSCATNYSRQKKCLCNLLTDLCILRVQIVQH